MKSAPREITVLARSVISDAMDQIAIASTETGSRWNQMDPDFEKLHSNPTLGAAANGVFLDVMEAQLAENRAAEIEGRQARIAKRDQRFPGWDKDREIHSSYADVTFGDQFEDGEPVRVTQSGPSVPMVGNLAEPPKAAETPVKPRAEASPAPKSTSKAANK